ncbi:MAG: ABC transporter permease [Deltaproteobacteria bacterium]|nr:ABC transporter permease [Deltaproteobacteria bacterium]MDQ3298866.1 FtsX-like permease family protein [Myxococcota bacterium]
MLSLIAIPIVVLIVISAVIYFWKTGGELFGGGLQYKTFVAWRYLLVNPARVTSTVKLLLVGTLAVRILLWGVFGVGIVPENPTDPLQVLANLCWLGFFGAVVFGLLPHSKLALYTFIGATAIAIASTVVIGLLVPDRPPTPFEPPTSNTWLVKALVITNLVAGVIAFLAMFFGSIRAFFTFFTTVPIGGVWIGTCALVWVLAVMSGFESDLRDKILGSNAHIQITREDGEFVNWREVKARIDRIPGVVASSPYAVSEVVIAANNNGMPVIIKGIDPTSVGGVTDLIADLEDKQAIDRMQPLVDEGEDRVVPQVPVEPGTIDPPPPDMPNGGEPIDFSGEDFLDDAGTAEPAGTDARPDDSALGTPAARFGSGSGTARAGSADAPFGGDAADLIKRDRIDPTLGAPPPDDPPDDLVSSDDEPVDYSEPDARIDDSSVHVIDVPLEPSLSRRTQALPGILVGRELVKQTHLYTGEEVRIVSPLSDPANPDATGTPIPFNRDYRVAGVFYTGMYEYDLKFVYVTLESLQDFLDRGDTIDGIEVRITDPDETGNYVPSDDSPGLIAAALGPGYRVQDWRELNRSLFSALKLEKIAMFLVLGIVILVASFSIVGNLIMVVVEKGREIALLKTLGASDVGVMQLFAIQGLLIGLIGTALGVASGLIGCWAGKRFGLPLNPDVYYIDRLPIHVDPASVIASAAAGVLISIAATFYPALLAARVRPAAGMRH